VPKFVHEQVIRKDGFIDLRRHRGPHFIAECRSARSAAQIDLGSIGAPHITSDVAADMPIEVISGRLSMDA
jgi:hypothetical protein